MFGTIKRLMGCNLRALRKPIALNVLDAVGSMAMYFVLYLVVVDLLHATLAPAKIGVYTAVCLASVLYRCLIYRSAYLLSFTRAFRVSEAMRLDLANHMRSLSLGYFGKNNAGYLLGTLTNDMNSFEGILSHAFPFLTKTAVLCGAILIGTFFIDWKLALAQCAVIMVALPVLHWGNRLIEKLGAQKRGLTEKMVSSVLEFIRGIKVFRSHNMDGTRFGRMLDAMEEVRRQSIRTERKLALPTAFYAVLTGFLMPLVLLCGSYLLLGGQISQDSFVAFLIMSLSLSVLLITFEHYYNMVKDLRLAATNLEKVWACQPLPYDPAAKAPTAYDVAFNHVDFHYESGGDVLHDITFTAPAGSTTALIGPSGSGKSTIASLIARFWDVGGGSITIGGVDIRRLNPDTLLESIGKVFQENLLLTDTVAGNIRVGRPSATDEEVRRAAKAAHCHEFIEKLSQGYDTMVEEGGASLSGGERQRIAIARAILKDAPILLLDESTASLDADNESKINRALDCLMADKTVFVIAHRLHTIQNADQIILLNEGHIEEMGNHDSLMAGKGHYYRMVKEQEKAREWSVESSCDE